MPPALPVSSAASLSVPAADSAAHRAPFVVIVSLAVKREHLAAFTDSLNEVLDAMRLEDSFVNTVACRDPQDETRFLLFETWLGREDFMARQLGRPYRRAHEERLAYMLAEPRTLQLWEPLRGDFCFGNGPMQGRLR